MAIKLPLGAVFNWGMRVGVGTGESGKEVSLYTFTINKQQSN